MIKPPLPAPYVPVVPGRAPAGMIAPEAAILNQWLRANYKRFDSVTYNVRVGRGVSHDASLPDNLRQMNIQNSQRRIDALLTSPGAVLIVEVKVRGSLWAIGQLEGYRALLMRDNIAQPFPSLLMLCASIDDDTAYCCSALGIDFEVVPTGAPGSATPTT